MNGADTTLPQTSKDVLGDGDGLLQRRGADVLGSHGGGEVDMLYRKRMKRKERVLSLGDYEAYILKAG